MTKLAATPEWLEDSVQHKDTCWSAEEGFKQCNDDEAAWGWDELDKANNADDVALCPGCAEAFLTSAGDFSNGVLVTEVGWLEYSYDRASKHLTPFAERPAHSGEYCDACASISWVTVFVPELGGWVSFNGDTSPDNKTWMTYADELPPRVLEIAKGFGIDWALELDG